MVKKIAGITLAAALAAGSMYGFAGCGEVISQSVDETKTQLYVGNYDGGVGTQWLYDAADRFEEMFADYEFEPGSGKVGVEVIVTPDKTNFHGDSLLNNMASSENQVFFTERANYETYATSGAVADISDILDDSLEEFGDTGTIADKLDEEWASYLDLNGKVYALPHYRLFTGIQYNVDMFEYYGFYFAADGGFVRPGSTAEEDARSAGPDGEERTPDDGLPATYDEFFELCDYMLERNVTPVIWTGENKAQYTGFLYWALYADYEGKDKLMPNFTFTGSVDDIVTQASLDAGDPSALATETVSMKPEDGWQLRRQLGRYYALSFLERLVDEQRIDGTATGSTYYDGQSTAGTFSHLAAQTEFVSRWHNGELDPDMNTSTTRPVAMLLDGNWWQNEADLNPTQGFGEAVNVFGETAGKENRRFAVMPMPKAEGKEAGTYTLVEQYPSSVFINSYTTQDENMLNLAKMFVKFICTESELQYFTAETGVPKSLNYTMPENLLSQMTYYEQNVWYYNTHADVVLPYSDSNLYRNNASTLWYAYDWETDTENIPVDALRGGMSAYDYFKGMAEAMSQDDWNNTYSGSF